METTVKFIAMHVGARSHYAPEGGMNVEISPTFATVIGHASSLAEAVDLMGAYWSQKDSPYRGSMIEHLIIVDTSVKKGNSNVLSPKLWKEIEKKYDIAVASR